MTGQNRLGWADGFPPYFVVAIPVLHSLLVTGSQLMSEAV
jgi:hypothetical protein